jgi:hypothetical protein
MPPKTKLFDSDDEGETSSAGGSRPAPKPVSAKPAENKVAALYDDDEDAAPKPVANRPKLPPRPKGGDPAAAPASPAASAADAQQQPALTEAPSANPPPPVLQFTVPQPVAPTASPVAPLAETTHSAETVVVVDAPAASPIPTQQPQPQRTSVASSIVLPFSMPPPGSAVPAPPPAPEVLPPTPFHVPPPQPLSTQPQPPVMANVPLPRDASGAITLPPMAPPPDFAPSFSPGQIAEGDGPAWNAFIQLQKQLQDAHIRTQSLQQNITSVQLTHEKEASDLRLATHIQLEHLHKEVAAATENYTQAQAKIDALTSTLNRKAQDIMKLQQSLYQAENDKAELFLRAAHLEDKAKILDNARQVAEVRQKELELSLEHSVSLVNSLRKQLYVANDDKLSALQTQYEQFEENRKQMIKFYAQREEQLLANYNHSLRTVQAMTDEHVKVREKEIAAQWQRTIDSVSVQYKSLEKEVLETAARHQQEKADIQARAEQERERWISHLKDEIVQLEQRHARREEEVLSDIARRERELAEKEQLHRVQSAREQQEAKIALLTREAELKAYYEKIVEDLHRAHTNEREKLMQGFRDQLDQLHRQHETNERELERLHREKEREMAQRYRVAGYEVDDVKKQVDMQNVTSKTQSSLLAKFEAAERSQRERAEATRMALKGMQDSDPKALPRTTAFSSPIAPVSSSSSSSPPATTDPQ